MAIGPGEGHLRDTVRPICSSFRPYSQDTLSAKATLDPVPLLIILHEPATYFLVDHNAEA